MVVSDSMVASQWLHVVCCVSIVSMSVVECK